MNSLPKWRVWLSVVLISLFSARAVAASPANDNFANRIFLGSIPNVTVYGDNTGATLETGEGTFGGISGASVWYEWTAPSSGWFFIKTDTTRFPTVLGLFSDGSFPNLTQVGFNRISQADPPFPRASRLTFFASAGTHYRIAVQGEAARSGSFSLNIIQALPPELRVTNLTFVPNQVNVTAGGQMVLVQAAIENELPQTNPPVAGVLPLHGGAFASHLAQVSGTTTSGLYQVSLRIPPYVQSGPWLVHITGTNASNSFTWSVQGDDLVEDHYLIPPPVNSRLIVINTGPFDLEGPSLQSAPSFPALVFPDAPFTLDLSILDSLSSFSMGVIYWRPASFVAASYGGIIDESQRISGSAESGTYRIPFQIPSGLAGTTVFPMIYLWDKNGNRSVFTDSPDEPGATRISPVGSDLTIKVASIESLAAKLRPSVELRRDRSSLLLDYYPPPSFEGVALLHASNELSFLKGSSTDLADVPLELSAGLNPITYDVTGFEPAGKGFFSVTEFPGRTLADFADPEPEVTEPVRPYFVESLAAIDTLVVAQPITVSFRLLDPATMLPANISGSVRLGLLTIAGEPVSFPYTLTPASLPLSSGVVNGTVAITSSGDLSAAYLAVVEILPASPPPAPGAISMAASPPPYTPPSPAAWAILGILRKQPVEYKDIGWNSSVILQHPLQQTVLRSGSYGEWRKSKTGDSAGQPHLGLDLVATPTTEVRPVRPGIVSYIGDLGKMKGYVVVNHGNGYATRYLHVDPKVLPNQVVGMDTVIATVADLTGAHLGSHLHLEILESVPVDYWGTKGVPGSSIDPAVLNASFSPRLIDLTNDIAPPAISLQFLWNSDPKSTEFLLPRLNDFGTDPAAKCLVAQIVDYETGNNEPYSTLVPASIRFFVEDPVSQALIERRFFSFRSEADVYRLFQSNSASFPELGYVRPVGGVLDKLRHYLFWFRWDTPGYASQPKGPRRVQVEVTDRLGRSTAGVWYFGPLITDPGSQSVNPGAPGGSTFEIKIRNMMGPFPTTVVATPDDELKLSIQGSPSYDASLENTALGIAQATEVDVIFDGHDAASEQTWTVRVKLKPGATIPTAPETLTIKATSGVFPSIAHKIAVQVSPLPPGPAVHITSAGRRVTADVEIDGLRDFRPSTASNNINVPFNARLAASVSTGGVSFAVDREMVSNMTTVPGVGLRFTNHTRATNVVGGDGSIGATLTHYAECEEDIYFTVSEPTYYRVEIAFSKAGNGAGNGPVCQLYGAIIALLNGYPGTYTGVLPPGSYRFWIKGGNAISVYTHLRSEWTGSSTQDTTLTLSRNPL